MSREELDQRLLDPTVIAATLLALGLDPTPERIRQRQHGLVIARQYARARLMQEVSIARALADPLTADRLQAELDQLPALAMPSAPAVP
jgi:hypothetical protein